MTNLDYIKSLPKEKLAKLLIKIDKEEIWDYDYEENPYLLCLNNVYYHPFKDCFFDNYEDALKDCINYLSKKKGKIYLDE